VRTDIRFFDPDEVARLDTAMWRSYYQRRPLALYFQLAELMRGQFHFPVLRSFQAAGMAARAALAFQDGHGRADYVQALPQLDSYYRAIRAVSRTPFDIHRTAELELEWWIIHRERLRHPPGDLESALAEAAASLYGVPPASLTEYARERAAAMDLRDTRASRGVRESDWAAIYGHLARSWRSLSAAVRPAP
jgi:hypothetical protein